MATAKPTVNGENMKRLSIGERMRKAKSLQTRHEIATDWSANWQAEHDDLVRQIEKALQFRDVAKAGQFLGQLKAVGEKRFPALQRVIDALSDEDIA
jgi:phenylalanine-4-hydroxylase